MNAPTCGDCGAPMELRDSRFGKFYGCVEFPACRGTHGAHPDGRPLGVPSTKAVREARIRAHAAFDPLWESAPMLYGFTAWAVAPIDVRKAVRGRAYAWLREQLGMTRDECHMSRFDEATCDRVVELCRGVTPADIRAWAKARKAARAEAASR